MKMTCKMCKRTVKNSFVDKLAHMVNYHPDTLLVNASRLPNWSRTAGEKMADLLIKALTKGSTDGPKNG